VQHLSAWDTALGAAAAAATGDGRQLLFSVQEDVRGRGLAECVWRVRILLPEFNCVLLWCIWGGAFVMHLFLSLQLQQVAGASKSVTHRHNPLYISMPCHLACFITKRNSALLQSTLSFVLLSCHLLLGAVGLLWVATTALRVEQAVQPYCLACFELVMSLRIGQPAWLEV
jgi:hypothetical protein